jgi:serine/threonine protein kinase
VTLIICQLKKDMVFKLMINLEYMRKLVINHLFFPFYRYCEGGELFHYIIEKKHLSEQVAAFIMKQIFTALEYLHS